MGYDVDFSGFSIKDIEAMKPQAENETSEDRPTQNPPLREARRKLEDTKETTSNFELEQFRDCRQEIINYLDKALGNKPRVVLTLSRMREDIGMNSKTLFKHLKTLRQTHFILKNLGYATEVSRRNE